VLILRAWGIILVYGLNEDGMQNTELGQLEVQIEQLLRVMDDLQAENKYLRHQLARHARAKSLWHQTSRQTAAKIKKIINHLEESLT
jgi:uncharacterized protein (TIGR02449 family)